MMNKMLVVAAHCDDELLGAGCYIDKLIQDGKEVYVCCMTSYSDVREEDIDMKMRDIHKELGIKKTYVAPYGASVMDSVAHIDKVQFIEGVMLDCGCDTVITHSDLDLHKDHVDVSNLTMEAVRYYQRMPDKFDRNCIEKVMMMEIPCASLWGGQRFDPNMFVGVSYDSVEKKIKMISKYDNVIRRSPHPRSPENIYALATVRGAMCGERLAEAFKIVFEKE